MIGYPTQVPMGGLSDQYFQYFLWIDGVHTNAFDLRQLLGISSAPHYGRSHRLRIALFSQLSWRVIDFSLHDYIATTSRGTRLACNERSRIIYLMTNVSD